MFYRWVGVDFFGSTRRGLDGNGRVMMRARYATGLFLLVFTGCMPAGAEFGSSGPTIAMEIDKSYRPRVGDRATLYCIDKFTNFERVPLLVDVTAIDKFERISRLNEAAEVTELEDRGELCWTPAGTRIAVLKVHDRGSGPRLAVEVRILEGSLRDKIYWTPLDCVVKYRATEPK